MMLKPFNLPQSPFDIQPQRYGTPEFGNGLSQSQPAPIPFQWGAGGARLTPAEILARDEAARKQMQGDYSPIGHWTQGLARVFNNVTGALEHRRMEKAAAANKAESDAVTQALLSGSQDNAATMQAMVNPYVSDDVRNMAGIMFKAQQPKQSAPHYWETNDGSLGMVGPDGQPRIVYDDPNAKMQFIPDGFGGGQWQVVPRMSKMGDLTNGANSVPTAGADPTMPVGKLTPIGGGSGNAANPFP